MRLRTRNHAVKRRSAHAKGVVIKAEEASRKHFRADDREATSSSPSHLPFNDIRAIVWGGESFFDGELGGLLLHFVLPRGG